jgi:hypothetical protein
LIWIRLSSIIWKSFRAVRGVRHTNALPTQEEEFGGDGVYAD